MKSLRRKCAALALLSAGLVGSAQAQVNPYGIAAQYPSTNQPPTQQYATPYSALPVSTNSGPTLTPATMSTPMPSNTTSLISGPPVVSAPGYPGVAPLESVPPMYGDGGNSYSDGGGYGGGYDYPGGGAGTGAYSYSGGGSGYGYADGGGCDSSCAADGGWGYGPPPRLGWFGSVSGLIMTRDNPDHYFFSFERTNEANQLTDSKNAHMQWGGGFDTRFGHYFNCGMNAWQVVYWGLFPSQNSTVTTTDGITQLDAILNFSQLNYNGGAANLLTDDAQIHGLFRDNEIHNVELNLLQLFGANTGGSLGTGLNYNFLAGARYFKFRDHLLFAADTVDRQLTGDPNEIYYDIDLDNNLVGFQVGAEGDICLTPGFTLDFGTKFGIFNNHISHFSQIGGAAGVATINNGPNLGRAFQAMNSKNDVAFLAEINLGAEYCISDCWTLNGGYRAVAVTGVALPTNQIYPDLRGIQDVELIASNGSLILHGAYFGAEFCY